MKDLTGQRFGDLTVIEATTKRKQQRVVWRCACDCGNEIEVVSTNLIRGHTKSCGCLFKKLLSERRKKDRVGMRYGMLVVIRPTEKRAYNGDIVWELRCDCGTICYRSINQLTHKNPHCGCMTEEIRRNIGYESIEHLNSECVQDTNAKKIRSKKIQKNNTSGVRGVVWYKNRESWHAEITFKKKRYSLGYYKNKEEAIKVRKQAEEMMFEPFLEWYEEQKKLNKIEKERGEAK